MHYIADDLDTDAWVKAGLARLERYLACWRLFTDFDEGRTVNKKLGCLDIVGLVSDYIENALPAEERRRFEHHLTYCPGCVTYVDQIRETIRLTGRLPREEPLAPALREGLLSQFRSWKRAG